MDRRFLYILVLVLISTMSTMIGSGCDVFREEKHGSASSICAQINGKTIYLEDFERELFRLNIARDESHIESEEQIKILKKELLLLMIDRELLIQEAESMGIKIAQGEIDVYMRDLARGYPPGKFPMESQLEDFTFVEVLTYIVTKMK